MILCWTDGSCVNKDGTKGGYGILMRYEDGTEKHFIGGSYINSSSARCEIRAIVKALEKVETGQSIIIYSDSEYCVNTLEKRWIFKWHKENYRGKKNNDLWRQFYKEYERLNGKVRLKWCRGHSGIIENEIADALARMGADRTVIIKDVRV